MATVEIETRMVVPTADELLLLEETDDASRPRDDSSFSISGRTRFRIEEELGLALPDNLPSRLAKELETLLLDPSHAWPDQATRRRVPMVLILTAVDPIMYPGAANAQWRTQPADELFRCMIETFRSQPRLAHLVERLQASYAAKT